MAVSLWIAKGSPTQYSKTPTFLIFITGQAMKDTITFVHCTKKENMKNGFSYASLCLSLGLCQTYNASLGINHKWSLIYTMMSFLSCIFQRNPCRSIYGSSSSACTHLSWTRLESQQISLQRKSKNAWLTRHCSILPSLNRFRELFLTSI